MRLQRTSRAGSGVGSGFRSGAGAGRRRVPVPSRAAGHRAFTLLPVAVLSLALFGEPPSPLAAQGVASAGAGLHLQSFSFQDEDAVGFRSVRLLSLPLAARAELGSGLSLSMGSAWVQGRVERLDGSSTSLTGTTDLSVALGWSAPGGWAQLSVVGVAPSGTTGFTEAEIDVAGFLAADLFPFRVSNLGTGGGFGGGISLLHAAGPWGFAASTSYLASRSFEPVREPAFEYRPGNQFSGRVVVDRQVGRWARAALAVTLLHAAADEVEGGVFLQPGTRVQVVNSWAFPVGMEGSGLLYGGYLHREGARLPELGDTRSDQALLLLGAGLRQPTGLGVLVPTVDARLLRRDDGEGQGWMVGVGATLERSLGLWKVEPSVVARLGSVEVNQNAESGITGFEVGVRLRHGGGGR
jgi:hypothetical protein